MNQEELRLHRCCFTGYYQVRNEWMVDRSNFVIAVFNASIVK